MALNRPTQITDESKYQETMVNGTKVKYAQHEDNKAMYSVKNDDVDLVILLKDGGTLEGALADVLAAVEERKQQKMFMIQMMMQHPELLKMMMNFGGEEERSEARPSSPGTSRFGFGFGGRSSSPELSSDNDDEMSFSPRMMGM